MRFISTRVHGILDYLLGIILIASPWILGFDQGGAETVVPVVVGISVLLYSIFTDYEMGMSRKIPMQTHLTLDILGGIFLAISPWIFNFNEIVWAPHLIFGILEIGTGLSTSTVPENCRTC
jgi:hypothetical protein